MDEVICGFGRVGDWFGSTRYHPPDLDLAKGITSAYAPLGAVVASERAIEPFFSEPQNVFTHGITFGGHPLSCAIALANIEIYEREGLIERVRDLGPQLRSRCEQLLAEHPMVGDVRGDGYFYSLELVKDKVTKETFAPAERDQLIKGFLTPHARARRLHPLRRPGGDVRAVRAAVRRRSGRVRGNGWSPAPGARRGLGADQRHGMRRTRWLSP